MKERSEILWRNLFAATDILKLKQVEKRYLEVFAHVTLSQFKMIRTLYQMTQDGGEGVPLKELAAMSGTTPAASSEMVDSLVRKKVLERRQASVDRRQVRISLSPELFKKFKESERHFSMTMADFLATLPEEKQALLEECSHDLLQFLQGDIEEKIED